MVAVTTEAMNSKVAIVAFFILVSVVTFGSVKYGDNDWKNGLKYSRLYAACLRHLLDWFNGENFDKESGLNHLDHAMCNLAFLKYYQTRECEGIENGAIATVEYVVEKFRND